MRTNFILDEDLHMIRERIQEAYKKIIYISDNDFLQDSSYKRANQLLYSRIRKLENQESKRPIRVSDKIPNSNLAKYGEFEYDEERERGYTTGVSSVELRSILGPDEGEDAESWMLPAVEQIFVHTILMDTNNFKLYEQDIYQLEKTEATEADQTDDKIKRNRAPFFERAPSKPPMAKPVDADDVRLPYYFNVQHCDEMLLRKRLLLEVVKDLWDKPFLENCEKLLKVYKSSLDNIFVEGSVFKYIRCPDTERNLQILADSIVSLNEKLPQKVETVSTTKVSDLPPVKRLYSDVVQGNKSPTKTLEPSEDISLTFSKESSEELFSPSVNCDFLETTPQLEFTDTEDNSGSLEYKTSSPEQSNDYSDVVNTNFPNDNILLNDYPIYDSLRNSTTSFQNFYTPVPYIPNTTAYNANYRLGYSNTFTSTFAASQQVPNRPNVSTTSTCQQHPWFFSSYRPPSLCSYGNFLGQLLVPQMPTKHRWGGQHYTRPLTPQSVYQPINQNWSMQNVYRTSSGQTPTYPPAYEAQKVKATKKPQPTATCSSKFVRSKTPESVQPKTSKTLGKSQKVIYPGKILSKPNSDYKLMTRPEGLPNFDPDSLIPIGCSASDELQKIALREYQSSNELFFNEIERQAEEQYDGNPENSCCPPNKRLFLGGHIAIYYVTCVLEI